MIYLDEEYRAHAEQDEGTTLMPWADDGGFFAGKCSAFIEGYRVVPENTSWQREDGATFFGLMISPIVNPMELAAIQAEADAATISALDQAIVDMAFENVLLEMGVE